MSLKPKIAILILAAGSSSRLGRPKQLLPFKNKTLLNHTIHECQGSDIGEAYIVLGAHHQEIRQSIAEDKCKIVYNPEWKEGMNTSITAAIRSISTESLAGVILTVADQPFLTASIFSTMMNLITSDPQIITCKYDNGGGPPTYFSKHFFDDLTTLEGDHGAKELVQQNKELVHRISFPKGDIDIDQESDLEYLK